MRQFTRSELAEFNGQDGKSAYVAVNGTVYDVTQSRKWPKGSHMARHLAGNDLTVDLNAAPHNLEVFEREGIFVVGTLVPELIEQEEDLPPMLLKLFDTIPLTRRHLHPIAVHFPTAFGLAAVLFAFCGMIFGASRIDFHLLSDAMVVLVAVFTPLAVATGFFTWWVNYSMKPMHPVSLKIKLGMLLGVLLVLDLLIMAWGGYGSWYWPHFLLKLAIAADVVALGAVGGELVFPTHKH